MEGLLKAHVEAVQWLNGTPAAEKATKVNAALKDVAGKALAQDVIDRSLQNIVFTVDPLAGAFKKLLQDGVDAGTTKQAELNGLFDLTALNGVTAQSDAGQDGAGQDRAGQKVSAAGLGRD